MKTVVNILEFFILSYVILHLAYLVLFGKRTRTNSFAFTREREIANAKPEPNF